MKRVVLQYNCWEIVLRELVLRYMLTSSEEEEGNVLASAPTLTDLPRDGGGSGGRNRSAVGQVLVLPKSILQKRVQLYL